MKTEENRQDDKDYELTLEYKLTHNRDDMLSILYPELPEDYFKDKEDALQKQNPLTPIYRYGKDSKITPYIKTKDLNNQLPGEDNKPIRSIEAGIKFNF